MILCFTNSRGGQIPPPDAHALTRDAIVALFFTHLSLVVLAIDIGVLARLDLVLPSAAHLAGWRSDFSCVCVNWASDATHVLHRMPVSQWILYCFGFVLHPWLCSILLL